MDRIDALNTVEALGERLELLLRTTNDAVWEIDFAAGRAWCSPAYETKFGALGCLPDWRTEWTERIHPEDRARAAASLESALSGGAESWTCEYRLRRRSGGYAPVRARASIARDSQGTSRRITGIVTDVTASLELLEAHFQNAPLMVVEYTPDFRLTRWSAECELVFGWRAEEVLGRKLSELRWVYDEDAPAIRRIVAEMLEGRARQNVSLNRNYRKDGSVVWCEWYNSSLYDTDGRLESVLAFGLDVTERKRAEHDLAESRKRLEVALDAAELGTWEVDLAGSVVTACPRTCAMFDFESARPLISDWVGRLHPEDRERVSANLREALAGTSRYDAEYRTIARDGTEHWVLAKATAVEDAGGRPVRLVGVAQDITERKRAESALRESEERYKAVVTGISDGVWEANLRSGKVFFSDQWKAMLGYAPFEIADDMREFARLIHPDDRDSAVGEVRAHLRGETPAFRTEFRLRHKDGSWRWILSSGSAMRDANGTAYRIAGSHTDVTERKRMEEEIRRSEGHYRLLFETMLQGVVYQDAEGRIISMNPAAERILGKSAAEFLGSTSADQEKDTIREDGSPFPGAGHPSMVALASGREVRDVVMGWYNPREKQRRWINVSAVPLFVPNESKPYQVYTLFDDITERKQAEQALRESEDKFRTLADSIPQLAWMTDENGSVLWYNRRWYAYTGTTLEEVQGWGWEKVHHPEHLSRVVARFRQHLQTGAVWEDTFPLRGRDGQYRWFLSRAMPIRNAEGRVERWFGTNTDITERLDAEERLRQSEERFRRLYEANVVGIVCGDPEKVFDANDVFLGMLGYTREELDAGILRWREFTPPEYLALDENGIAQMLATGSCKPFEKEFVRRDGSRVPVLIGATLLERSPLRWICFTLDLTERKQLERRILQSQKLESIGLLAGGIAHDFNNLLVAVIGNASLVKDMLPPGSLESELSDRVIKTGEQLAHLTRQMLAYSGKGRFVLEFVDLSGLVVEMSGLIEPSISKKIAFHYELDRDLPAIEADRSQMQQVFMNLVLNAAEAIGSDCGLISVKTGLQVAGAGGEEDFQGAEPAPGNYVYLEVRDTGCGMDDDTRTKIFDPFFSTKFMGRGLGLAAVAGIIRGHRGAVKVVSAPGKGSCFTVLFPAAKHVATAAAPKAASASASSGTGTVLVVDDEALVRETARRSLERRGYKVLLAESGLEAIDIFKRHTGDISLVVLDLSMPGMSGEETLPELRKIRPGVKVMVSSGYSESETMKLFRGQRVAGFIQKPYTSGRLADLVKAAIEDVSQTSAGC